MIILVNNLKKIKSVDLDIMLTVACQEGNSLNNVIRWVLTTLSPKKRLGWLLSVALDYIGEKNQD